MRTRNLGRTDRSLIPSDAMTSSWQIVCPDGRVRHYPYRNRDDALADAHVCDHRGCQFYAEQNELETGAPPCTGAPHRVQMAVASCREDAASN
jgi:hypothetical protein